MSAERTRNTETEQERKLRKAHRYPYDAVRDPTLENLANVLAETDSGAPKLVRVVARVLSVEKRSKNYEVSLATVAKHSYSDCEEHGKITGVDPDGTVRRKNMNCMKVNRKTTRLFYATFEQWPVGAEPGTVVDMYGDLESVESKGKASDSRIIIRLTGRHVGCFGDQGPSKIQGSTEDAFWISKIPKCSDTK